MPKPKPDSEHEKVESTGPCDLERHFLDTNSKRFLHARDEEAKRKTWHKIYVCVGYAYTYIGSMRKQINHVTPTICRYHNARHIEMCKNRGRHARNTVETLGKSQ